MGGVGAREGKADADGVKREVDRGLGSNVDDARGLEVDVDAISDGGVAVGFVGSGMSVAVAGVGGVKDNDGVLVRALVCVSLSSESEDARTEGDTTGVRGLPKRERGVRFLSTCVSSNDIRETSSFSGTEARATSGSGSSTSSSLSSFSSEVSSADLSASRPKLCRTPFQAGSKDQSEQRPCQRLTKRRTMTNCFRLKRDGEEAKCTGAGFEVLSRRPSGWGSMVSKSCMSAVQDVESGVTTAEGRVRLRDLVRWSFGKGLRPRRRMSVSS
jgi:predicted RecA/RadA family phage recombinase